MNPEQRLNNLLQLQRDSALGRSAQISQELPQRQHQSGPGGTAPSTNSGSVVPLTAPILDNPTPSAPSIQQSNSSGMTIHPTTLSNGIQVITRPAKKKKKKTSKFNFYGVCLGPKPGVYMSWEEAKPFITGLHLFGRGFETYEQALAYSTWQLQVISEDKWYGVKRGQNPGVYQCWEEVIHFNLAHEKKCPVLYKAFASEEEAFAFVNNPVVNTSPSVSSTKQVPGNVSVSHTQVQHSVVDTPPQAALVGTTEQLPSQNNGVSPQSSSVPESLPEIGQPSLRDHSLPNTSMSTESVRPSDTPTSRVHSSLATDSASMTTGTVNNAALGSHVPSMQDAQSSKRIYRSFSGKNNSDGSGLPPPKRTRVEHAASSSQTNIDLHQQTPSTHPDGNDTDEGFLHIDDIIKEMAARKRSPSQISVIDLCGSANNNTDTDTVVDDDDDDSGGCPLFSDDTVNTSSTMSSLPSSPAPDSSSVEVSQSILTQWFRGKTQKRVEDKQKRALNPYTTLPPLPNGEKRPRGRPRKAPMPEVTIPKKRGRPRKDAADTTTR